mmetsp:Transcript_29907/g.66264  ORF Transcript_29907/g.66264 Transcript_29907/m.66264 type:complete len:1003 (-) Transcript_29907:96-3104(-)
MRTMASTSISAQFHRQQFHRQVDLALRSVRKILSTNRHPVHASDVQHQYTDKYALAEFLTNVGMASTCIVLDRLGLTNEQLIDLHRFVNDDHNMEVTLRFEGSQTCTFVEERKTKVESPHESVATAEEKTKKGFLEQMTTTTSVKYKTSTIVTEHVWRVENTYSIYLFAGADPKQNRAVLQSRTASTDVVMTGNSSKVAPYPASKAIGPFDTSLTWLLQNVTPSGDSKNDDDEDENQCRFKINRDADTCKTPRRNEDVEASLEFFALMDKFCGQVQASLLAAESVGNSSNTAPSAPSSKPKAKTSLKSIGTDQLFVPVLPLFEEDDKSNEDGGNATGDDGSPLLSPSDVDMFLSEQCRSLDEALAKVNESFGEVGAPALISPLEARIYLLSLHTRDIVRYHSNGISDIEAMLTNQLTAAIGKTISADDFNEYTCAQMGKVLFKEEYAPVPFSYSVRRPNHSPDGIISIERTDDTGKAHPIVTSACRVSAPSSGMRLPISAATSVGLTGDIYLHGWLNHQFGTSSNGPFELTARARQFSCFMLCIGKIGQGTFEAQDAIILQNKDELMIPLLLNQLPSPKEFKDAIISLSPEQRRFAEAFRAMQLQSSVFGVCCIQLKPQLEMLLGLPPDALTKEVKMTQNLLELFIDYQIPSDLLSFDGTSDLTVVEKVDTVKKHTASVLEMIESIKVKDLKEAERKADMAFELAASDLKTIPPAAPPRSAAPARYERAMMRSVKMATMAAPPPPPGGGLCAAPPPPPGAALCATHSGFDRLGVSNVNTSMDTLGMRSQGAMMLSDDYADVYEEGSTMRQETVVTRDELDPSQPFSKTPTSLQGSSLPAADATAVDFTAIPKKLDSKFEALDKDNALRTTTIKPDESWRKKEQKNLLSKMETRIIERDIQKSEKEKAFDLLDALSRSGSLPISCSELHVIVCATYCFDKSIIETCIHDNVNPLEKMEASSLILSSTIQGVSPQALLKDNAQIARMKHTSPLLICDASADGVE